MSATTHPVCCNQTRFTAADTCVCSACPASLPPNTDIYIPNKPNLRTMICISKGTVRALTERQVFCIVLQSCTLWHSTEKSHQLAAPKAMLAVKKLPTFLTTASV